MGIQGKITLGKLNRWVSDAQQSDDIAFKEMRSSVRLHSGQHYSANRSESSGRGYELYLLEDNTSTSTKQLRLTLNHVPRILDAYMSELDAAASDVEIVTVDTKDVRASRLAQMNMDVWNHYKMNTPTYEERFREDLMCFSCIGEVASKLYWSEEKNTVMDEAVYGFELLREAGSSSLSDSAWLIHTSFHKYDDLVRMFGEKVAKQLRDDYGETFQDQIVFNTRNYEYEAARGANVYEFYLRPCPAYPQGQFAYFTEGKILSQGDLPNGLFPIITGYCQRTLTMPRGHGVVRSIAVCQHEINRTFSQDATNMVQFGSSKIITNANSNMKLGRSLHGSTHIKLSTSTEDVRRAFAYIEGTGIPKYVDYIQQQAATMDKLANISSDVKQGSSRDGDMLLMIYSRIRDKRHFAPMSSRWQIYLKQKAEAVLSLMRYYLEEDDIIRPGNREDGILVSDFKETGPEDYLFKAVVAEDAPEVLMGKMQWIREIMQYAGQTLTREDLGRLMREYPMGNSEKLFGPLTQNYDDFEQDLLMLEKGLLPRLNPHVENSVDYKAAGLVRTMNQPDFMEKPPLVVERYHEYLKMCEDFIAQKEKERMMAEKGLIPASGYLVKTDFKVPYTTSRGQESSKYLEVPSDALRWLVQSLESQGVFMGQTDKLGMSSGGSVLNKAVSGQ